ncbi:MAG: hypothetical protein IIA67_01235 [Planctomycetes bacterium]|nr:hypothetical protein [Planctomycetota bacterium]
MAIAAVVVIMAGTRFTRLADTVADRLNLSAGWVGLVLLATVTSLPELVTGATATWIDNVDLAAPTARGIVVMNTPYGNSTTTAEHTIALLMSLARGLPAADRSTRAGKWEKSRFIGVEVVGKTLGLVGCGNIGSIVANRAQGLAMRVIVYDPYVSPERASELGVEKIEFDDLLARADFISLHVPLNDQTRAIIDRAAMAKMKPGVRIINCARGGLVVEDDLVEAIVSGHLGGAAMDVTEVEPLAESSRLWDLPNVIITPHVAGQSARRIDDMTDFFCENLRRYQSGQPLLNLLTDKQLGFPIRQ